MTEEVDYDAGRVLEALNDKVDRDFGNVPSNFVNFAKYSKNVTNCITEIPQDIKLELADGTLTLKAGSKAYDALGNVINIPFDVTVKNTGNAEMYMCVQTGNKGLWAGYKTGGTVSERPSSPINYALYYNTSTQKCEYYNGSNWMEVSLPIAIVTRGADGFTSIDQVFNGFGYIGSTVFALPNVKGLIPNGRNEDGNLKNIEFTTQNILLRNNTEKGSFYLVILDGGTRVSIAEKSQWVFDEKSNRILGDGVIRDNIGFYGDITLATGGVITSFTSKLPFRAVDYNDKETVIGWMIPDYDAVIQLSNNVNFVVPVKGIVVCSQDIYINGVERFHHEDAAAGYNSSSDMTAIVEKGWVCKVASTRGRFYPFKGVN